MCLRLDQQEFWLSIRDFNSWRFVNFYVQQEAEGSHLLDRLCSPDNFNHSHQITQSEKMLIIATRRNGKLYLLASLLQFGTEGQLPENLLLELLTKLVGYKTALRAGELLFIA